MRCPPFSARLAAILLIGLAACSDSTSPGDNSRPPGDLNIIRLAATSPLLLSNEASFYAVQGEDREVRIFFQSPTGGEGEEFVRLRVRPASLLAAPGGTPIAAGDSILITLRVVDPAEFLFEMEPSGLTFSQSEPAELKIHYNHADDDFNEDGVIDIFDDQIRDDLAIWRQENPADPFVRLGSVNEVNLEEINVDLFGFTRYAIAY